jgi:hypothetical protein
MNEQTKTHIEHAEQIEALNKQIRDLKIRMAVANECHDLRIKDLSDRDVKIQQLETTINDVLQYLKIDSNSPYLDFETRIYCDKIIDLLFVQYYENTGTDLIKND